MMSNIQMDASEILQRLRSRFLGRGWKVGEHGEWVEVNRRLHVFIWSRSISVSTLRSIAKNQKVSVKMAGAWRLKKPSSICFICIQPCPESIPEAFSKEAEVSRRALFYDLSLGRRFGEAHSLASRELEDLLGEEFGLKIYASN